MGLNMTLEQAQAQSASISSVCQAQVQDIKLCNELSKPLQKILKICKEKAYDSSRNYYQLVLLPLA